MKGTGPHSSIDVIGADANNLRNVDVTFPLKQISVVTGVSGSGKSSLLADTLAGEGSRRMRTFLGTSQHELERDDVRAFISALPPTILVGQRGFRPSVRTTVGTATGFLAVLRRLFFHTSAPYSERAKEDVPPPSPESYAGWISKHYRGLVEVWAAPVRQQRTDGAGAVKRLASHGVEDIIIRSETDPPRLRETGRAIRATEFRTLNPNVVHTIEALIGAVQVNGPAQQRALTELLARAFPAGNGSVVVALPAAANPDLAGPFGPRLDSKKHWVHPGDPAVFARPSVHLLSFNAPEHEDSGACRACGGTGIGRRLLEDELVPHPDRSMSKGALAIWTEKNYKYVNVQHETIEGLRGLRGFSPDVPWAKLPATARTLVLDGSGDELIFDRDRSGRKFGAGRPFPGFKKIILDKSASGTKIGDQLANYVATGVCDACGGTRWSFQARALRVATHGIAEILGMTFDQAEEFAESESAFARSVPTETRPLVEAIHRHAHSIVSVGLGYLTGDRGMLDVSEGESRRIRLSRVLDAQESGLCLLFDEPARGLHEADLARLGRAFERMRGQHTVILNEHRERLWDTADWLVEVGPGAGVSGGQITFAGPRSKHRGNDDEMIREPLAVGRNHSQVAIKSASIHNVDNVDCEIPLGRLTCICGVSGSGKSSFVRGVLAPALLKAVGGDASGFLIRRGRWRSVTGTGPIAEVIALDQAMPPSNRRSLVATFTGVFDDIRKVFGTSADAKRDGLSASDFGVNSGDGRCPACLGIGEVADGDLWSVCPVCGGSRYSHAALSVRIAGVNIQELLDTPVASVGGLAETFHIPEGLTAAMCDLGIGYVALGRRMDTLSGGEVQRVRLAMRLAAVSTQSLFFILDEPAVGLHPTDVRRLSAALERVLDGGRNTVLLIEHDLRLIRSADWVIEFGPGSGPDGGHIVFRGTPDQLAGRRTPTGLALAGNLSKPKAAPTVKAAVTTSRRDPADALTQTTALMRALISGDAPIISAGDGPAEPTVVVSDRFWSSRDAWEVAGLDFEIPKFLLDVQRVSKDDVFVDLLARWQENERAWLAIHPFLSDMQVWGVELPSSTTRATSAHISTEGLRLVTTRGDVVGKDFDVRQVRATGARLVAADNREASRLGVLKDAFAIGAGYVELRDQKGSVLATASSRLLDLETGVVAPMVPQPLHFLRHDPLGHCPMCSGRRVVNVSSEALVIANKHATPDSERFLTREANAVMKGIRRNELSPFLRRLAAEGLWDSEATFDRLDRAKRDLVLFGFWSRPGPGSFLKSPSANPAAVSAWLRWDGLHQHILEQADRSEDQEWGRRVRETARPVRCVLCQGTGLRRFAGLLQAGDLSFSEWTLLADHDRAMLTLRKVNARTERQRMTRQRILYCLGSLSRPGASVKPVTIVQRAVGSFTTMPTAQLEPSQQT